MKRKSNLNPKKKYLQIALNSTLDEAERIIRRMPLSDRIILEAGTPLIKKYGEAGIRQIYNWYSQRIYGIGASEKAASFSFSSPFLDLLMKNINERKAPAINPKSERQGLFPYVAADLKTMDRGETEVSIAASGGASAAIALGSAPTETLNSFVSACEAQGLDSMIDMMNIEYPLSVLRALKKIPTVVILHRGVDEENFNREKQIPLYEIRRIKGNYDIMISIAGGDTIREVQRSIFNDADIVVIWKEVYQSNEQTVGIIDGFLKEIK